MDVTIAIDGAYGPGVRWAAGELASALESSGHGVRVASGVDGPVDAALILAGIPGGSSAIAAMRGNGELALAKGAETLAVLRPQSTARPAHGGVEPDLVVAGADERGLMYALLETADQVRAGSSAVRGGNPFASVADTAESPDNRFRGIYIFLHNADCERAWFYSREHWEQYFGFLARCRYNSFQIVMGHQTAYLAPPFPFFVEVPEHPEVAVPGLAPEERTRNLAALNLVADLAAARGLEFVLGIWEVIAWKPETSHGTHVQRSMVDRLDWSNLESYTYHAARRLLAECPGIRGVQVRVNPESGVPPERQTAFFTSTIFRALKETGGDRFLDLRGWLAQPQTIEAAQSMGIPMRLSMKYWAEHLGAPYQAARQEPAYSYADFLRYPRRCAVSYQVWALGSHRHFVWGDPEYARAFSRSLSLGGGIGFEICPPLAQKGYGNEPGAWRVLYPQHEYYTWEWERYWLYYLVFGRLAYSRAADEEIWMRELRRRFGSAARLVMEAYRTASKVVSYLIRFSMSDPNMYVWPEADTGGLLDFLIEVEPSDPAMMKGYHEAAYERISGAVTAKTGPREASDYLNGVGTRCLELVSRLRAAGGDNPTAGAGEAVGEGAARSERELASTMVDFEALGELALYHAEKARAGEGLALYYAGAGAWALHCAADRLRAATPHWNRLAEVTDRVYTDRQVTGPIDSGHWKDKRMLVREDEERIDELIALDRVRAGALRAFDFGARPEGVWSPSRVRSMDGRYVERGFAGVDRDACWGPGENGWTYGWLGEAPSASVAAPGARFCDWHIDPLFRDTMKPSHFERLVQYRGLLYRDYVGGVRPARFAAALPSGRYRVTLLFGDRSVSPARHGPFTVVVNGTTCAAALALDPDERREVSITTEVPRGRLEIDFAPETAGDWFVSALVVRGLDPVIGHVPEWSAPADSFAVIRASVSCPDPVTGVTLHVRAVFANRNATGAGIPELGARVEMPMQPCEDGSWHEARIDFAALPASLTAGAGDAVVGQLDYWFTARSAMGRVGRLRGPQGGDRPFRLMLTGPGYAPPEVELEPVPGAAPGAPVTVRTSIRSAARLRSVRLHYRYLNQYYDWNTLEMEPVPAADAGRAEGGSASAPRGAGRDIWSAEIPGGYVVQDWDLMYYVEAIDEAQGAVFAPAGDWTTTIPYRVIAVTRYGELPYSS